MRKLLATLFFTLSALVSSQTWAQPGVYIGNTNLTIEAVEMGTTAFIAPFPTVKELTDLQWQRYLRSGSRENPEIFFIGSMNDFNLVFEGVNPPATDDPNRDLNMSRYLLQESLRGYFAAGGKKAYIVGAKAVTPVHYSDAISSMKRFPDAALVLTPGLASNDENLAIQVNQELIQDADQLTRRFVIIESPNLDDVTALQGFKSFFNCRNAGLFAGWIKDFDISGAVRTLPPGGIIAGTMVNALTTRGIHNSGAGLPLPINDVSKVWSQSELSQLNLAHINPLTFFNGRGSVIWGARTTDTINPQWKFIPTVRTDKMISDSIQMGLSWLVFEPNEARTWSRARIAVKDFLTGLWRQGVLRGSKPEHAFFVQCGLGQTMTANDILQGRIIVETGFAPTRPAEFLIQRHSFKSMPPQP